MQTNVALRMNPVKLDLFLNEVGKTGGGNSVLRPITIWDFIKGFDDFRIFRIFRIGALKGAENLRRCAAGCIPVIDLEVLYIFVNILKYIYVEMCELKLYVQMCVCVCVLKLEM